MDSIKRHARTPFASALLGGLVVALLGWLAIAAGWIKADDDGSTIAARAADRARLRHRRRQGPTVNDIYSATSPGVAFVQAEIKPDSRATALQPVRALGRGGIATGSGIRDRHATATCSPTPTSSPEPTR